MVVEKAFEEAIALHNELSYQIVENYGPYVGIKNSVCFEKRFLREI